jgi:hypothetical protein
MRIKFLQCALFAFISIIAISCKKETESSNNTDYFVKIKKDGVWLNFPTANIAGELGPDGFDPANLDLGVAAQTADGTQRLDLTVQIVATSFPTGTYHSSDLVQHPYVQISYVHQPSINTTPVFYDIESADGMAPSAYTVNVTEITSTTLRGNFTGNYLASSFGGSNVTTAITEGEFFVKRIR